MHSRLTQAERLLRASFLALLMLGLLVGPLLSKLSEIHAVEHGMAIGPLADGHGHSHDDAADPHTDGSAPEDDHTDGAHGLMHQSGGQTTFALAAEIGIPCAPRRTESPPNLTRSGLPQQPPSNPFRPPIA